MIGLRILLFIALKDYVRDRQYGLVSALLLTAVLTPILVLFGIKNGIVEELFDRLRSDPSAVELQPIGQGRYDEAFFVRLREMDIVSYVIPTTRFLSTTAELRNRSNDKVPPVSGELVPTSEGDPLWGTALQWRDDAVEVVLSTSLIEKLKLATGNRISGRIGRFIDGRRQAVDVQMQIVGQIPLALTARDFVLVPLPFLLYSEDYRENRMVKALDPDGEPFVEKTRTFASFRLYVKQIEDVAVMRNYLVDLGIESKTALQRINLIQSLNHVLSYIFWIVTGLATLGYFLAASVQSSLTVIRKLPDIAVLKLLGFSSEVVSLFPVLQSLITGFVGAATAIVVYYLAEVFINDLVGRLKLIEGVVASLPPTSALIALALTLLICLMTASIAGWRTRKILPVEGLRHD